MRKRVQIALAVLLVATAGVIAWQVLREREPVYQGKGLRVWLREYREGLNTGTSETAESAVVHIGTNAIPTLVKMLDKKDSKLVGVWERHICESRYLPVWVRYPDWYKSRAGVLNVEAELGFKILGADAQQAVPALIKIYERNISASSQGAASRALIAIGPAARKAIPSFLQAAASSNETVRFDAVAALSQVHAEPQLVVPALVKSLNDTNSAIRMLAAIGLRDFRADAQPAVPTLVLLLCDRDKDVRLGATNALRQIDPEAAAKAGVK